MLNYQIQKVVLKKIINLFSSFLFYIIFWAWFIPVLLTVSADVYTVTKTDDTADGVCNKDCSFREAVDQANKTKGFDEIQFVLSKKDKGYINPDGSRTSTSELAESYTKTNNGFFIFPINSDIQLIDPDGTFINGYSQENAKRNTKAFGQTVDSEIMIQVSSEKGSKIVLSKTSSHRISGLNLVNIQIYITEESSNNWIEGNYIGSTIDGMFSAGNNWILIDRGSWNNLVGTNGDGIDDSGERNIISGISRVALQVGRIGEKDENENEKDTNCQ